MDYTCPSNHVLRDPSLEALHSPIPMAVTLLETADCYKSTRLAVALLQFPRNYNMLLTLKSAASFFKMQLLCTPGNAEMRSRERGRKTGKSFPECGRNMEPQVVKSTVRVWRTFS